MTNEEIGRRIERARLQSGLNKKELARKIGVADSTIKRYEHGEISKIKIPIIESIAIATNVSPMWIIGKSESMERTNVEKFKQRFDNSNLRKTALENNIIAIMEKLNNDGKKKLFDYSQVLLGNPDYSITEGHELNAAHARTDIEQTLEGRAHDDAIMSDDSEWE